MVKAILRNGTVIPLDPVPSEWEEGAFLQIEKANESRLDIEAWAQMMDRLCQDSPLAEEERMQATIDAHRQAAKTQARREMGLVE